MYYILRNKGINEFKVIKRKGFCYLIPSCFNFKKYRPNLKESPYKRVVTIEFYWLIWEYNIQLRKQKKQMK